MGAAKQAKKQPATGPRSGETIAVVVVEDHTIVRAGLCALLEQETGIEVTGQAADGRAAIEVTRELRPAVVVMDVTLPELNGIDATRHIVAERPDTRVLALSMHSDRRYVTEMLRAGAAGYLLKDCAVDELARAIRQVASGDMYLGAGVTADLVEEYIGRLPETEAGICAGLTPREREVLQLLAEGCTTKEAAARLDVSVKTIETHRANMMRRLELHSLAELTEYAIREGLTTLES